MIKNKRFVNRGKDIFQYGEWWCSANGEHCADVIATAMNEVIEENEQLKKALLFFLDVANSQCSSSFRKDMEHDCQKLFNCSYDEAKDKYGNYDTTWWELGE